MKVGLQLWTVYDMFMEDPLGTLEKVAKAGYKYVEITNHSAQFDPGSGANVPVEKMKAKVDELGIQVVSAHIMPSDIGLIPAFFDDQKALSETGKYYQALGAMGIAIPVDYFPTYDYLMKRCESYNRVGKILRDYGLQFMWHSHFYDFQKFDGKPILDIIMENTDPQYFGIELDAYWILRGAMDPAKVIHQYGDRIHTIHQKDWPYEQLRYIDAWTLFDPEVPMDHEHYWSLVRPGFFTEIGTGAIKIQDIVDAGVANQVEYIFVEQEFTKMDKIESITLSYNNFKKINNLDWTNQ